MPLPPTRVQSAAGGVSLSVIDYRTRYLTTAPAGASGTIGVTFDPVPPGYFWLLQRFTVLCTSSTKTRAMVYAGDPAAQNLLDGTEVGNLDIADEQSPILLDSNTALTVQWTGASAGAVGTVRVQYQLVQRG